MSGRFGFPVFTIARLLEVNGMIPFRVPWIPIIVIIATVLSVGALIFGRKQGPTRFLSVQCNMSV